MLYFLWWVVGSRGFWTNSAAVRRVCCYSRLWSRALHLLKGGEILGFPDAEGSQDWVNPMVGVRLMASLTEKLWLTVRGDIRGFDIRDASWASSNRPISAEVLAKRM